MKDFMVVSILARIDEKKETFTILVEDTDKEQLFLATCGLSDLVDLMDADYKDEDLHDWSFYKEHNDYFEYLERLFYNYAREMTKGKLDESFELTPYVEPKIVFIVFIPVTKEKYFKKEIGFYAKEDFGSTLSTTNVHFGY